MLCLKHYVLLLLLLLLPVFLSDANAVVRMTSCMQPDCHQDGPENVEMLYTNICKPWCICCKTCRGHVAEALPVKTFGLL